MRLIREEIVMEFVVLTKEEYSSFFNSSHLQNFGQSVEMAKMRESRGWEIHYVGVKENDILLCAATLQSLPVYRGYKLFMALRGFLVDYHNEELLRFFIQNVKAYVNDNKCLYMKIDPYISYQPHDIDGNAMPNGKKEDGLIALFEEYGFVHQGFRTYHDDEFEPRWISVLNTANTTEEEILKNMHSMTKRNIAFTKKNNIEVCTLERDQLSILDDVIRETGGRKNFHSQNLAYYTSMYDCFKEHFEAKAAYIYFPTYITKTEGEVLNLSAQIDKLEIACAQNPDAKKKTNQLKDLKRQQEVLKKRLCEAAELQREHGDTLYLAAAMFLKYDSEILYLFGGSYEKLHQFKGSYAIQWDMIKECINRKIPRYNFYGISGNFHEDAEDYGVYLFKKGFHADVVELLGDFIYIADPKQYKQYQMLRKIKHKILRR